MSRETGRVLLLLLLACCCCWGRAESVRETETWMPMNATMSAQPDDLVSSGDLPNGSDFGFVDDKVVGVDAEDDDDEDDTLYDDEDEGDSEFSGSGAGATTDSTGQNQAKTPVTPDVIDNKIPEDKRLPQPKVVEEELLQENEISVLNNEAAGPGEERPSNVLMSHASDESIFNKTEVLAALIAGGAVGLMFAVLLILLLIYRMKKKDEGSYALGNKPIYKKAPTTEIYA